MSTTPNTSLGTSPGTHDTDDPAAGDSSSGVADKAQNAKHAAQETASTAADETRHVAGVAGEEARKVAGEAKDQARHLWDEALGQVDEQSRAQRDRLVGTLDSFSSDLVQMAEQSTTPGLAADVARQVAERARALGDHLDGRAPADLLDDVRSFARRRPGVFLLGALTAGVLAGRLARGAKAATDDQSADVQPTPPPPAPATVTETPLPTVGQPQGTAPVATDPLMAAPLGDADGAGSATPSTQQLPGPTP
jgi:vacuolar-type H+-ATPase subunit H